MNARVRRNIMRHRSDRLWIALAVTAFLAAAVSAQPPATLIVEVNRPKAAVSPMLYGLMTEEINYSYDGGLYAELIRNRAFLDNADAPVNWSVVKGGDDDAVMSL